MEENETAEHRQISAISMRSTGAKIALIAALFGGLWLTYFAVRWQLGRYLAQTTPPLAAGVSAAADFALSSAPREPWAHWFYAQTHRADEDLTVSVESFENAARLAPDEYRFWLDLGRIREQQEQFDSAEVAFKRALELAPNYSLSLWNYGNFLLRRERRPEAFGILKKAAARNSQYRQQVIGLAWDLFAKNPSELEELVGDAPAMRASLAQFYAVKDLPADSWRNWSSLNDEEKKEFVANGDLALRILYDKRFFGAALAFAKDLGVEDGIAAGQIYNGGFETNIKSEQKDVFFNWKINQIKGLEIVFDPLQKHSDQRSLRLSFSGFSEPTLQNVVQFVPTDAGARYRLKFFVKAEGIKSAGAPLIEITDTKEFKRIAASAPLANGSFDWKPFAVEFTAPTDSQAVSIRVSRQFCGEMCPIFGVVNLDDFSLEKISK